MMIFHSLRVTLDDSNEWLRRPLSRWSGHKFFNCYLLGAFGFSYCCVTINQPIRAHVRFDQTPPILQCIDIVR